MRCLPGWGTLLISVTWLFVALFQGVSALSHRITDVTVEDVEVFETDNVRWAGDFSEYNTSPTPESLLIPVFLSIEKPVFRDLSQKLSLNTTQIQSI